MKFSMSSWMMEWNWGYGGLLVFKDCIIEKKNRGKSEYRLMRGIIPIGLQKVLHVNLVG